jgi:ATP-dependent DNA ligase
LVSRRGTDQHSAAPFEIARVNTWEVVSAISQDRAPRDKLLARSDGIRFSEHLDGDGAIVFKHACKLGLEGIVSKRRDLPYRSGRSKCWIKLKNPASAAMLRIKDGTW